jgi:hypothetical protein
MYGIITGFPAAGFNRFAGDQRWRNSGMSCLMLLFSSYCVLTVGRGGCFASFALAVT